MRGFVGGLLVLGLAGFDPISGLLAIAALASGARRREILVFAAICLLVPTAMGIALSLTLGATEVKVSWSSVDWDSPWLALLQGVLAVVLLVWALRRTRSTRRPIGKTPRGTSMRAMVVLALGVGGGFILDPIFLAVVVFAGRAGVWGIVIAHATWTLMCQPLVVVVALAVATGRDQPVTLVLNRLLGRFGPVLRVALTWLIVVAGLLLAADVATYVLTGGRYLLHGAQRT